MSYFVIKYKDGRHEDYVYDTQELIKFQMDLYHEEHLENGIDFTVEEVERVCG